MRNVLERKQTYWIKRELLKLRENAKTCQKRSGARHNNRFHLFISKNVNAFVTCSQYWIFARFCSVTGVHLSYENLLYPNILSKHFYSYLTIDSVALFVNGNPVSSYCKFYIWRPQMLRMNFAFGASFSLLTI